MNWADGSLITSSPPLSTSRNLADIQYLGIALLSISRYISAEIHSSGIMPLSTGRYLTEIHPSGIGPLLPVEIWQKSKTA
jgi:hypothetical protein